MVVLGRIKIKNFLFKAGIVDASEVFCVLCGVLEEDVNYFFIYCEFFVRLWGWWLLFWGYVWCFLRSFNDLFLQWFCISKGDFFGKVWVAVFFVIVWLIWKEWNGRIFEKYISGEGEMRKVILLRLVWWIFRWGGAIFFMRRRILRDVRSYYCGNLFVKYFV